MIPAVPGALDGLRVLDLSWGIAGSLGVLMLAEQGADVIKVEPPGGDPFRGYTGYAVWNRSRRSVTLDLKHPEGQAAFHKLAADADVLVETFRPGVTDRLGIGFDTLHAENPRLVYCSCPAYPEGHRLADRPGYDALVQAASGQQWEQPGWRLGPIFLHMPMPSMAAMFLVPTGILAALIAREDTGRGQHVRTSLLQGAFLYTTQIWTWATKAPGDFWTIMSKSYPAGSHQEMIFEAGGEEWVHMSIMSGLAPDPQPGRHPRRRRRGVEQRALRDALRGGARADHAAPEGRVPRARARLDHRPVPREQPRDRGDRADG